MQGAVGQPDRAYRKKPTKNVVVDGENVKVRYPDAQTIRIWEYRQAGLSRQQIADKLGFSMSLIDKELQLYRQTAAREWPIAELRSELATLAPKAKADIEAGLAKGTGYIGIKLMEGLGVLNPKVDLRVSTDNQPTEEQLIQVCVWAKDIPVLRLAMLKALGAEDTAGPGSGSTDRLLPAGDQQGGRTDDPGSPIRTDGGTPEHGTPDIP